MEEIKEALRHIEVASILVHNASCKANDFNQSKPLNILYKELRASIYLLLCYTGDKQAKELVKQELGIDTPFSIIAYVNLNSK